MRTIIFPYRNDTVEQQGFIHCRNKDCNGDVYIKRMDQHLSMGFQAYHKCTVCSDMFFHDKVFDYNIAWHLHDGEGK